MNEIASREQLRMSFLRWALVIIPLIMLLGFVSGKLAGSGDENLWFMQLEKPDAQPPGWVFGAVWTLLYAVMGAALTLVVAARGSSYRGLAILAFAAHFVLNIAWSPLFFGMHQVSAALILLLAILAFALATTWLFGKVRVLAAWLMVPYLAWLCFAAILNFQIDALNPNAETLQAIRSEGRIELAPPQ